MVWQTMNERIRQLLSQAGVHYEVLPKDTVYEKFAELIVKECAGKVDWILAEGGKTQGDLIKQHFGVKE
jgi:hypothetical protein